MKTQDRLILHIGGLLLFVGITTYAIYQSPLDLLRINPGWLLAAFILSALAIGVQGLQTSIFLKHEAAVTNLTWAVWMAAEKAWVNSIFPAKAGTASTLLIMQKKWSISWLRYAQFMFFCALAAAMSSITAAAILIYPDYYTFLLVAGMFALTIYLLRKTLYPLSYKYSIYIVGLAILTIGILSAGVGACISGLGYTASLIDYIAIGIALNILSIIAITPGNFGVREAALVILSPLLPLNFETIIQGSTCYVVLRLVACLLVASLLRPLAFPKKN